MVGDLSAQRRGVAPAEVNEWINTHKGGVGIGTVVRDHAAGVVGAGQTLQGVAHAVGWRAETGGRHRAQRWHAGRDLAAQGSVYGRLGQHLPADPFQRRDGMRGCAAVIAQKHGQVVGAWADHRDGLELFCQRQQAVVLEQHDGFLCGAQREAAVRGRVVDLVREPGERRLFRRIKHPQAEPCRKQARHGPIDRRLVDETLLDRFKQRGVCATALQVATHLHRQGRRLSRRLDHPVPAEDIVDGPAVGDDVALETPFLAQDLLEQPGTGAAWLAVHPVVRAHDGRGGPFLHARLERGQVGLAQVALAHPRVELMAAELGTAVDGEVLRRRHQLEDSADHRPASP